MASVVPRVQINSAGSAAVIGAGGSTSLAANDLTLKVAGAVADKTGLFFYGAGQASQPFGNGTLCLSSGGQGIFRMPPAVTLAPDGSGTRAVDYASMTGAGQVSAGSTWYFQFWYRDPAGGGAGFNLSDGLQLTFCP